MTMAVSKQKLPETIVSPETGETLVVAFARRS